VAEIRGQAKVTRQPPCRQAASPRLEQRGAVPVTRVRVLDGPGPLYSGVSRDPSRLKELEESRRDSRGLSQRRPEPAPPRRDYSSAVWTPVTASPAVSMAGDEAEAVFIEVGCGLDVI